MESLPFFQEKGTAEQTIEITEPVANRMYDIAVRECGAPENLRDQFVSYALRSRNPHIVHEFRFRGSLASGGKLYFSRSNWWIDMYPEDRTEERITAMNKANTALRSLRVELCGK